VLTVHLQLHLLFVGTHSCKSKGQEVQHGVTVTAEFLKDAQAVGVSCEPLLLCCALHCDRCCAVLCCAAL